MQLWRGHQQVEAAGRFIVSRVTKIVRATHLKKSTATLYQYSLVPRLISSVLYEKVPEYEANTSMHT